MNKSVSTLTNEVEELKEKPGKRWDTLAEKVSSLITAAIVAFMLAKIGL